MDKGIHQIYFVDSNTLIVFTASHELFEIQMDTGISPIGYPIKDSLLALNSDATLSRLRGEKVRISDGKLTYVCKDTEEGIRWESI